MQNSIPELMVGGIALPFIVYIIIAVAKYVELVKNGLTARRLNVILSLILGGIWVFIQLVPEYSPIIGLIVIALVGSLGSALVNRTVETAKYGRNARSPN